MGYAEWKIHGDETLAAYLPDAQFKGILERRIAVPPDLAAILIRDGRVVEALRGAHFSVGGVWQRLKELFGGSHAIRLLVADLKPFPILAGLKGFTKDNVEVQGEIAIEFQLNPEKPVDVMGLVGNGRSLTKADVYRRVRPHLQERVAIHELVQHNAAELRANRGLQDRIQADFMKEVERLAGDMGLLVRAVSVNWAMTADERQAIAIRNARREDDLCEFEHARVRREIERSSEATTFRLKADLDMKKLRAAQEAELEQLLISNALSIQDTRDAGARLAERKALLHDLQLAKDRRLSSYDQQLGDEENELERTRIRVQRERVKLEFEAEEQQQRLSLRKLEQMQELEVASIAHDLQARKLGDLQRLELEGQRARHELARNEFQTHQEAELERRRLDAQAEIDKLKLQGAMNPDQLLALQAGLSPEVARVFAERAKGAGPDREALLREMLNLSQQARAENAAQARAMFDKAVEQIGRVGTAAAGAPRATGSAASGSPEQGEDGGGTVPCPSCHWAVPMADHFCRNCGHRMRT